MTEFTTRSNSKWLWPLVIALLAVLTLVWLVSPSGNLDQPGVDDPIVTGALADPDATGAVAPAEIEMPGHGAPDPAVGDEPADPMEGAPAVDRQPAEAIAVPATPRPE